MQETWIRSPGQEDPLEEAMATHSSILVWRNPTDRGAWWATFHRVSKSWAWMKWLGTRTHDLRQSCNISELQLFPLGTQEWKILLTYCPSLLWGWNEVTVPWSAMMLRTPCCPSPQGPVGQREHVLRLQTLSEMLGFMQASWEASAEKEGICTGSF